MKKYILTDKDTEAIEAYMKDGTKSATARKVRSHAREALPVLVKDLVLLCRFYQEKVPTFSLRKLIQEAQADA